MVFDVAIIGAGVIGAMAARELSRFRLSVCLLEKENDVAMGASRANSGIIHGGYDPEPGTLKARLNTEGVALLYEAAAQLHVPHKRNETLVCAFSQEENASVDALYARGIENGIGQMQVLTGDEARALEPALSDQVTRALYVPTAGIICPYELTIAAVGNAMDNGVILKRNFAVASISQGDEICTLTSESGEAVHARYVLNCAGGFSDEIARMIGDDFFTIIPRSGEYLLLDKAEGSLVSRTIFQIPSKNGKGILVTPTADGNLLTGPTATPVDSPENRDTTPEGLAFVQKYALKSVPSVNFRQVITSFAGVRASTASGDFIIQPSRCNPHFIHVAAIDSPGLTCCVSIAKYVLTLLRSAGLSPEEKNEWNPERPDPFAFRHMTLAEKDAYIRQHPDYGHIICRCETVSEGEIRACIRSNPPALDLDGVKRRTRSGMGRCQGGFCSPTILGILSQELGIPVEQVSKSSAGSEIVIGRIGEQHG